MQGRDHRRWAAEDSCGAMRLLPFVCCRTSAASRGPFATAMRSLSLGLPRSPTARPPRSGPSEWAPLLRLCSAVTPAHHERGRWTGHVIKLHTLRLMSWSIVIRGPLDGDAQKILVGAIDQGISNRTTWGKIFIADLSQASPLEESDVQVLRDIQGRIRKSGGVLAVVDPHRHLPQKAKDLEFFYSTKEAITRYEKDVVPIDVQIYLSDESAAQEVQFAVEALLDHFGVSDLQGGRPEIGSWYRRLYGRTSRVGASEAGENLARSMDIQMIERHQTDIDAALFSSCRYTHGCP